MQLFSNQPFQRGKCGILILPGDGRAWLCRTQCVRYPTDLWRQGIYIYKKKASMFVRIRIGFLQGNYKSTSRKCLFGSVTLVFIYTQALIERK